MLSGERVLVRFRRVDHQIARLPAVATCADTRSRFFVGLIKEAEHLLVAANAPIGLKTCLHMDKGETLVRDDQEDLWGLVLLNRKEKLADGSAFAVAIEALDQVSITRVPERTYLDAVGDTTMLACGWPMPSRGAVGVTTTPVPPREPISVVVRGRTSVHRGATAKRVRRARRSR